MMMSDKLDELESRMSVTRNQIVAWILSLVMHCAAWSIAALKSSTDLDSLLRIKTISEKIQAELANELMLRNRFKKHTNVKNYDRQPPMRDEPIIQEAANLDEGEMDETQYFEANSDGSLNDDGEPFELNKEFTKPYGRVSQQMPQ